MRLFNTISLEVNSACNRKCDFCPVAYGTRPDERMADALLHKALNELHTLKYRGRIELYIYNEVTRDLQWCLRCIREARTAVPGATLMIASNGDYLRGPERIMQLYQAGLNQLLINCYSPGLYERRLAWLYALPADVQRTGPLYTAVSPKKRIIHLMDKSKPEEFGSGVFRIINRAGNIAAFAPAVQAPLERMCVKPFRLLNVNWQGEALLCCNDYHGEVKIGNLKERTLVQLWNHPVMNEYRRRLYKKDRHSPLCSKCDCHSGAYPHMVEKPKGPYAPDIPTA